MAIATMDQKAIFEWLTKDINELSFKPNSIASELFLYGPNAVPICVQNGGEVLIAAATYGKGRIVVLPHEAFLGREEFKPFLLNCLAWLNVDVDNPVTVHENLKNFMTVLADLKFPTSCTESLDGVGTYCCGATDANRPKAILRHVKNGGGLLMASQAWHWASQHPSNVFADYPGNKVTGPAGIFISSGILRPAVTQMSKEIPSVDGSSRVIFHPENDQDLLMHDTENLSLNTNSNSKLLFAFDPLVFPVDLPNKTDGQVVAGRLGAGRFVAAAHAKVFDDANGCKFLQNVIKWLLHGNDDGIVVLDNKMKELECTQQMDFNFGEANLDEANVFCCCSSSKVEPEAIKAFVEEGGGLLWCGQDCHSCDIFTMKRGLAEYPGNNLLNPLGVGILPSTLRRDVTKLEKLSPSFEKVSRYLQETEDSSIPFYSQNLVNDCVDILKSKDVGNSRFTNLLDELMKLADDSGCLPLSQAKVFSSEKSKFIISVLADLFDVLPEKQSLFIPPLNAIQTEEQLNITIDIRNEAEQTAWISTGLYAVPGETVTIIVPTVVVSKGLQVQIGCHSDLLFKKSELKRAPVVIRRVPIKTNTLEVRYLWGGLVYFLVPAGCDLGQVQVTVKNAAKAPFFKFGEHTVDEWRSAIRHHPAPWAELAADNIILTVPAHLIRGLDDPGPVLELWNEIMRGMAQLSAIPLPFKRPERIVADVQITAGAMHSGYPVMIHDRSAEELVDAAQMKSYGIWGFIHELGHNQQYYKWEMRPNTTEATCNLWAAYVHEKVFKMSREESQRNLSPKRRLKRLNEYMQDGAKFEDWKLWTALETYLQLQEGFGWEALIDLHGQYHTISCGSHSIEGKMNTYAEMFSTTVKKNLVPFFKTWGWNIDDTVAQKMSALDEWEDDPMRRFYAST